METKNSVSYFLGANSKNGFHSLYDSFVDFSGGDFLYIIKGGPGCGKSSFMKRIGAAAERAGSSVEYILCSGDPESLDGIWIGDKRIGYVDGTAPHAMEAVCPGAASLYLDLSAYYQSAALRPCLAELRELNASYGEIYREAYALLAAAAALDPRRDPGIWGEAEKEKLQKKAEGFARRELRAKGTGGRIRHRFISAISCRGKIFLDSTLKAQCSRICRLDNALGMGWYFLGLLAELAADRGYDITLCHDPLHPEKIEALIIPRLSLALTASEALPGEKPYRHMRLDAIANKEILAREKGRLRARRREWEGLMDSAVEALSRAKALHDRLEGIYNPYVDFQSIYAAADEHINALLRSGC